MFKWVFCVLVYLLILPSAALARADVGRIVALKGEVVIQRGSNAIKAALEEKIFVRDLIETKVASKTKILLNDNTLLTVPENSSFKIKEFMEKDKGKKKKSSSMLSIITGGIRALVTKGNKFEIQTPNSIVGVKGTFFSVWIEIEDGIQVTYIAVHEGSVHTGNIDPGILGSITLERGQMTRVVKGQPPEPAYSIPPAVEDKLLECTQ